MTVTTVVRERGATPKLMAREANDIHRDVAREMAITWHDRYVRKHFTQAGASEYGYTPRAGERGTGKAFRKSYTGRKLARFGHTRPLVFSGASLVLVLASRNNVRATATKGEARAVLRMNAPALNWRNPRSRIDMRDELTRVSAAENVDLANTTEERMQQRYAAIRATETTNL